MTGYGLAILPRHAALLEASAISPEVARERGYVSADSKKQVERHGFPPWQCRTGLLIPMRRADGSIWGYQLRADTPRVSRQTGKTFKYETPAGQRNGIDVPPGIRDALGDPSVPLLVTEGTRKADSAVSHGIACVALPGVWGWRGSNGKGGKTAVADWHDIALNGRRVVLAFDSDVTVKPAVRRGARRAGRVPGRQGHHRRVPPPARRRRRQDRAGRLPGRRRRRRDLGAGAPRSPGGARSRRG